MSPKPTPCLAAFSLLEAMVALAVLSMLSGVAVYGLVELNGFAAAQRCQTKARQLCHERIEQILVAPYQPSSGVVGAALGGTWPIATQSVSEPCELSSDTGDPTATIPAKRITEIALDDEKLQLLRITVTVRYYFRGRPCSARMATLRAPD